MKNIIRRYGVYIFISLFIAVYFELYREMRTHFLTEQYFGLLNNDFDLKMLFKLAIFFIISLTILIIIDHFKHLLIYIAKYRYAIGISIIILCTILELSGSSISTYYTFFEHNFHDKTELLSTGTLLGIPREIRTDDYATFTMFNFSQEYNSYAPTSDIIRATSTDVTTFYASPCFSLATIFRPFLWGYLLLGSAKGLAFYWSSRTVCLFLVSYEFCRLLTNKKNILSVAFATLITFSQTIQWWYSTNGLVEMFIFGELAIVLLYTLINSNKLWLKILVCVGLIECAGGYTLAYYPAQQIPLAYIFGAIALYIIVHNRKLFKKIDIILIVSSIVIFSALLSAIIYNSWDTIQSTMNTVYPGKRVNSGGGTPITQLFYWIISIFTPIDDTRLIVNSNVCESSVFYSLFPLGVLYSLYTMIKQKKADLLSILLIIIEFVFLIYCVVGFPTIIAKITLLSFTFYSRILEIIGFIDIILLFRALSQKQLNKHAQNKYQIVTKSLIIVIMCLTPQLLYLYGCRTSYTIWITATLTVAWLTYLILQNTTEHKEKLAITLICIISISGLCVNPLQKGANTVLENSITKDIKEIVTEDADALWIVVSDKQQLNNLPIAVGAKTVNSTNTYPNLDLWKKLDPDMQYIPVYNRYAHINMDITANTSTFELLTPDLIKVNINLYDLDKINISYILSYKSLDEYNFELIKTDGKYYIYKVQ